MAGDIDYATTQNLLEAQQAQIDKLAAQFGASQSAQGGFGDLTPIGPWPTATSKGKNGRVVVTLRNAIPSTTNRLKIVLEEYTGSGAGVTVVNRIPSADIEVTDDDRLAGQGDFIFPVPLNYNAKYGCISEVSIDINGNRVVNPDPGFPDSPRNESDYLITFTTPVTAANAPSKPRADRIVGNSVDVTTDGTIASVTLRVFADDTEALTFAAQLTDTIQVKLVKTADGSVIKRVLSIDDPSVKSIDVQIGDLQIGREYDWTKNTAFAGTDFADAVAASTVPIFAGGYADPTDGGSGPGLGNLTNVSIAGTNISDTQMLLTGVFHQPTPPYRLKNYYVERKLSSESASAYNVVVQQFGLQDPIYNTAGNFTLNDPVPVKPTKTYNFRYTFKAVGDVIKQFTSGDITPGSLSTATARASSLPGLNFIDGGGMLNSFRQFENAVPPAGAGAGDDDFLGKTFFVASGAATARVDRLAGGGSSLVVSGIQWRDTEGRMLLSTTIVTLGGKPAYKVRKTIRPSDILSFSCYLMSATADLTTLSIDIALVDQTTGDIVVERICTSGVDTISHTVQNVFATVLQVPSGYTSSGKQWLEMRLSANPAQTLYTTRWTLKRGSGYAEWTEGAIEITLDALAASITSNGEGAASGVGVPISSGDGRDVGVGGDVTGGRILPT